MIEGNGISKMRILQTVAFALGVLASPLAPPVAAQSGFSTLYNFTNSFPVGLTVGGGILYSASGGAAPNGSDCGAVFELQPPTSRGGGWTENVLCGFSSTNDACDPIFPPDRKSTRLNS